jgi:hypothetical protein
MKKVLRSMLSLAVGLGIGFMVAAPAFAAPGDIAANARANAAELYANVAANAAEMRANVGP